MTVLKKMTTITAAAAIALSGFVAAPAQAKPSDGVRVLQGLAALYIIGKVIESNRDNRADAYRAPAPADRYRAPAPRTYVAPRDKVLPLECVRWTSNRNGSYRALGKRCIERRVGRVHLPQSCERTLHSANGNAYTGYGRRCLLRRGYSIQAFGN